MADSPLARRREAGALLRAHRIRLRLKAADVAAGLGMSAPKMSRLERGERGLRVEDVSAICRVYALSEAETNRILALVRESQGRGTWANAELPDTMRVFFGLEASASHVLNFQPLVVPGLMQTEEYARRITAGSRPDGMLSDEVQAGRVEIRLRRKALLEPERGMQFHFIVDEAVVARHVLSPAGMARQIDAMIEVARQPNVRFQAVPFEVGPYPGMAGNFMILRFTEKLLEDSVFVEDLSGYAYYESESQLARFQSFFDDISSVALSEEASLDMLVRARGEWLARGEQIAGDPGARVSARANLRERDGRR